MASNDAAANAIARESENYLSELDRALHGMPVSRKSEIVLETRALLRRMADESSDAPDFRTRVLADLGHPRSCANRHRRAAGLPPVAEKSDFRWLRVLVAGSFAMFAVFVIALVLLIRSFLPVFERDEKTGRIRILGGWVEMDPASGNVTMGKGRYQIQPDQMNVQISRTEKDRIDGAISLNGVRKVEIRASDLALSIEASRPGTHPRSMSYRCFAGRNAPASLPGQLADRSSDGTVHVKLPDLGADARCEISVSTEPELHVELRNGSLTLKDVDQSVSANIGNGNVSFLPKDFDRYEVRAKVSNGVIRLPDQAPKARDLEADFEIGNGTLTGP